MFLCKCNGKDISSYVISYNWQGDIDQASRKLDFSIAYNTKDKVFDNQNIIIGDTVYLYYQDDSIANSTPIEIFRGVIFMRQRNTVNFTFEFTAYDRLIYLAKSKTTRKFSNIIVESVITQICNEMNIEIGSICNIGVYVDFIADNMSCTEIIKKAFNMAYWKNKKLYHMYMNQNKLYVVERSETIENYTASDLVNVESTNHSESIEDMINTIMIVDNNGVEIGRVSTDSDLSAYGKLQDVYKVDSKQDTQTAAKAMLKTVAFKSSLSGIGNIQCITGYAITVQEEQLKGKFMIRSDRHSISNNVHRMELDLEFLEVVSNA
jgi:hypothetical protein